MQLPAWLDVLERRLGFLAVPHLVRAIVLLNLAVFLLNLASDGFADFLVLDPERLRAGEYWRAVTFLLVPGVTGTSFLNLLFLFFFLYITWLFGEALEREWGAFKVTLFLLVPTLVTVAVALSLPYRGILSNDYIIRSLLFAFATLFPNFTLMLFPIPIPVKIKWLAWIFLGLMLLPALGNPLFYLPLILAGFSGYLLYLLPAWLGAKRAESANLRRRKRFLEGREDLDE